MNYKIKKIKGLIFDQQQRKKDLKQQIEKRPIQSIFNPTTHPTNTTTTKLPNSYLFTSPQPTKMSTHSQQQTQIMQTCQRINTLLQIPNQSFSLEALTHIDWYLTVLYLIYPQLSPQFQQIRQIKDEPTAIDSLLFMLTKEQIIEEDFLEIKGRDIVEGDVESVYYVVQLLNALIEREEGEGEQEEEQEGQEGEQEDNEQQQENEQAQRHSEPYPHHPTDSQPQQQQYSNDFQQSIQSNTPKKLLTSLPPAHNLPKPITSSTSHNHQQMFKNVFNHYDSQDQLSRQQERHSVLGIRNEFEDYQQEEEEEYGEDQGQVQNIGQQLSSGGKSANNATFGQQQQLSGYGQHNHLTNQHQQQTKPSTNQATIFPPSKPQHQPTNTNYKPTQSQDKQFPSSSSQQPNFYEQPSKNLKSKLANKKLSKPSKPYKQQTQEQDDNQYFINPTIKKYKSEAKLMKTAGSASKKSTTKKNLTKYLSPTAGSKQFRKLVSHPTIKKHYLKATDPFSKKLTQQVKTQASTILKKRKKQPLPTTFANPAKQQMQRKAKQLKVKLADCKKDSNIQEKGKLKQSTSQAKSSIELTKVLNWRQGQLKREKQEFQKAMEMKLQVQKQAYIKKINTLLIKLQKQKQLHQRQQYKQHLLNQNQQAAKRLTAIEQWYKDRIAMLKESNSSNRNQRKLMHTGHKEILKHIEKELKRENQKQIMAITMKYRKQEAQVENDLEELQREIIKVYKSH